jgi:hypothetical protein
MVMNGPTGIADEPGQVVAVGNFPRNWGTAGTTIVHRIVMRDERNGEEFEVRSSRFSELRTLNFESRLSRTSREALYEHG